jgi:uncharacterized protein YdeI (YjbR/CyaY-like superfamily)
LVNEPIRRPSRDEVTIFPGPADFRTWLDHHHNTKQALFVGFYKKRVPKTAMTYAEAVDEALCFGWIDGITYRIDDEMTATRFTPRRRTSSWSAINIAKVAELTAAGRMHAAGLRAFDRGDVDAARGHLERAVREAVDPEALNDLAVACHAAGDLDQAEALLRTCLLVAPGHPAAGENLAAVLAERGAAAIG